MWKELTGEARKLSERLASFKRWLCHNWAIKKRIFPKIVPLTESKYSSCLGMKERTKKSYLADSQKLFNSTAIKDCILI